MNRDKMINLALIGCGNFSDSLAAALLQSKKATLAVCCDALPERRERCSRTYGCEPEASYERILRRTDIDGVLLATPNALHPAQTLLAARCGKHVFVEKPIANTIADGRDMQAACSRAGVTLMVGHLRRRSAGIRKAKELIDAGAIGDPVMVEANVSGDSGFSLTPDKFRWRGDDTGCPGGALMTSGIHHVDTFHYLLGPVKSVIACFKRLYIAAPVEDVNMTVFELDSGVPGYLGATYSSPYDNWFIVHGTRAKLQWSVSPPVPPTGKFFHNQDQYTRLQLFEKGKAPADIPFVPADPVLEEIDEFAECILTGAQPETGADGALAALAFVRAAIDSARLGKKIELARFS
ncbi:MAG: Gfo/Idh/MocA family oxidoreductase [Thermodesulfobacteriota bacterium]